MSKGLPGPEKAKTAWPPAHCASVNEQYAEWDAWYSGDLGKLAAVYGNANGASTQTSQDFFGSETGQTRGVVRRVIDRVKRWFHGEGRTARNATMRVHVPLARQMAKVSAGLLFAEPPQFRVDDPATQARLDELVDDGAHAAFLEGATRAAALGGVFLAATVDRDVVTDKPFLQVIHPDSAVPEFKFGRLAAVTYWSEIRRSKKDVYRHLERHEPGVVLHAVYKGTEQTLGHAQELTPDQFPELAAIIAALDAGNEIATGYDRLTSVYIPNMMPSPFGGAFGASLGASDYDGVETLLDAVDLTASALAREVDLGKGRLVVPAEYLRSHGPGQGASMDLDREIYEAINADEATQQLQVVQFAIRPAEHGATLDMYKREIIATAGYSGRGFGLDEGTSQATATEVNSLDRRDAILRDHKARYWGPALSELLECLLFLDARYFPKASADPAEAAQDAAAEAEHGPALQVAPEAMVAPERPRVEWPPATQVDPEAEARTLQALRAAEVMSIETGVRTLHPDWDDGLVDEEVERIREDTKGPTEDPIETLGRVAGGGDFTPPLEPSAAPAGAADEDAEAEPAA